MKRRREIETEACSEIRSAIQELTAMTVNAKNTKVNDDGDGGDLKTVPIKPFISLCDLLMIQVLDKIGPTMAVMRQDIHHNIQRLEKFHDSNPSVYWDVVEIIKKETSEGKAKKGPTCSKAFVWLTRSLDFTLVLLQLLMKDLDAINMEKAVEESYNSTLKPWHGWISSAAYKVALKLVPDCHTLISTIKANRDEEDNNDTLRDDIQSLISLLLPLLQQLKDVTRTYGLDKLKST